MTCSCPSICFHVLAITAHIFFDDAMDRSGNWTKYNYRANDFVKLLVTTIDKAAG